MWKFFLETIKAQSTEFPEFRNFFRELRNFLFCMVHIDRLLKFHKFQKERRANGEMWCSSFFPEYLSHSKRFWVVVSPEMELDRQSSPASDFSISTPILPAYDSQLILNTYHRFSHLEEAHVVIIMIHISKYFAPSHTIVDLRRIETHLNHSEPLIIFLVVHPDPVASILSNHHAWSQCTNSFDKLIR